jgi:hypothetical protein
MKRGLSKTVRSVRKKRGDEKKKKKKKKRIDNRNRAAESANQTMLVTSRICLTKTTLSEVLEDIN